MESPDTNQNLIVRVFLFVFVLTFLANMVGQFINHPYNDPSYIWTALIPMLTTIVYAYYKKIGTPKHVIIACDDPARIEIIRKLFFIHSNQYSLVSCRSLSELKQFLAIADQTKLKLFQVIVDPALENGHGDAAMEIINAAKCTKKVSITVLTREPEQLNTAQFNQVTDQVLEKNDAPKVIAALSDNINKSDEEKMSMSHIIKIVSEESIKDKAP